MKLLFRRDQYQSFTAKTIFKLYAKIELENDEGTILDKYDFDRAKLIAAVQPNLVRNAFIVCLIVAALVWVNLAWINTGLFLVGLTIGFAFTTFLYGIPFALTIGAFFGWLYYDRKRETIYVNDLIHGRYFKCKSVIDLARKEAWLGVVTSFLRQIMESAKHWDGDENCLYGYNPMTFTKPEYRPLIASGLIEALKKQWSDAWGNRMEHLLRFALLSLLDRPGSSLEDIIPLFLDKPFRASVLASVTDPQVKWFWETEYKAMNFKNTADGVAPIANKLGAFLANPVVRKAICQPEKPLRFRQLMDDGQTLIVNLSKGKLGADISNVLGGLIVSSIANATLSRTNVPETERVPWFLFLDEWQSFTTAAVADMLAELRKYRLGLVLATQYSSRLDEGVREGIFGNVGTLISFRVGASDALTISKQFGADMPSVRDLVNLPNHEMYLKLMIDGAQKEPFSGRTLAP